MAMGNNVDTYGPGFAQHVYLGHNQLQHVWGNDREALTTDSLDGDFAGTGVAVNGVTVELPRPRPGVGATS